MLKEDISARELRNIRNIVLTIAGVGFGTFLGAILYQECGNEAVYSSKEININIKRGNNAIDADTTKIIDSDDKNESTIVMMDDGDLISYQSSGNGTSQHITIDDGNVVNVQEGGRGNTQTNIFSSGSNSGSLTTIDADGTKTIINDEGVTTITKNGKKTVVKGGNISIVNGAIMVNGKAVGKGSR
jgi:hypothetical protein